MYIIITNIKRGTHTNSITTCFPITDKNENTLSRQHPTAHITHSLLVKWFFEDDRNGHKPMPSNGILNTHLCVSATP